jgi:UDP-N-acetyl-D-mannosaminuronic acid dehydrogenase
MNGMNANSIALGDALYQKTLENIKQRTVRLVVIGLGYVGLPTAALFADAGFHVTGVDIKKDLLDLLNMGRCPTNEPGLHELIKRNVAKGRFNFVLASELDLSDKDAVIICVQTPVNESKKPDLALLLSVIDIVSKNLAPRLIIAVCSTIPPNTLRHVILPVLENSSALKSDMDFYLSYVPERIAPNKALEEFVKGPRLVGGVGQISASVVSELFKTVCAHVIKTDCTVAEIAKTAENTFRDVNIAFANQLALICEKSGADVTEVINLANTHPRVNIHAPGPGVGGPCLTKDPYLLIFEKNWSEFSLITTARAINDNMPSHVVNLVVTAFKKTGVLNGRRVAVLGTAYKANTDDARNSPSELIITRLLNLGFRVTAFDSYCTATFGAEKAASVIDAITCTDCLIIAVDHSEFKHLDLQLLKKAMNNRPVMVDCRRIINPSEAIAAGFEYFGIGYGAVL